MEFKNRCQLREEDHKYLINDGQILHVPSATSLVNFIYRFDALLIDPLTLKFGITRGNHIHSLMETWLTLGLDGVCCDVKTHKVLYQKAKALWEVLANDLEIDDVYSELPLYNEWYSGTIDALVHSKKFDKWVIIDFKTTSWKVAKTREDQEKILNKESLQLYLYSQLVPQLDVNDFYIINPNKGQCYQLDEQHMALAKWNYQWIMKYLKEKENAN